MSVTIENLGNLDRKITISFSKADTAPARTARLQKLSKTVKMPGFRPGKVPMKMVEAQYGMQVDFEAHGAASESGEVGGPSHGAIKPPRDCHATRLGAGISREKAKTVIGNLDVH